MKNSGFFTLICLVLLCTSSCKLTKYVPEGEYLVSKVSVHSDNKNIKSADAKNYIKQVPNHKTFGFIPLPLSLYNLSGKDTSQWINNFLRRCGTPPEIYDQTLTLRTEKELTKMMINKGFLQAQVSSATETEGKKIRIDYSITANEPMIIRSLKYSIADTAIAAIIEPDKKNSLIKENELLDRSVLESERVRLTQIVRNKGYWAFNKDYITYKADTVAGSYDVDLELNIRKNDNKIFYINEIIIDTDYDPINNPDRKNNNEPADYKDIKIINGKNEYLRKSVLAHNCLIQRGSIYSDRAVDATYSSFSRLKILKYVNIRFAQIENSDKVNCYILLTPVKDQTITTELEGTNSSGDFGFAAAVTYQHRNAFKGSETFTTKIRGGYENLTGDVVNLANDNYTEFEVETSLNFPKFMFPMLSDGTKKRVRASTELTASYNYQQRPEYTRVIAGGGLKYNWTSNRKRFRHSLDVIDVNYVYLPFRSEAFIDSIINKNPITYASYKDHLITRTAYTLQRSNYNPAIKNRDIYTFRGTTEIAGNILYAYSHLMNKKQTDGAYTLFDLRYEQYWKLDLDYAFTKVIDNKNSIAFHIAGGIGIPYGNSDALPFEKRYYSGGANGVRGWSVRTLGPGRYSSNSSIDYFNQCGDIRLDASLEYRSKLFWKLEMAAFVDAGNIWTIKEYETQNGGAFKARSFYKEIAMSWGLGMRFDFDYFIIRMDVGIKAYDPSKIDSDPWLVKKPFDSANRTFHFAVGYPF